MHQDERQMKKVAVGKNVWMVMPQLPDDIVGVGDRLNMKLYSRARSNSVHQ